MSGRRTVSDCSSVTADTGKLTTEGPAESLEGAARLPAGDDGKATDTSISTVRAA
jgi:hypothetical protein